MFVYDVSVHTKKLLDKKYKMSSKRDEHGGRVSNSVKRNPTVLSRRKTKVIAWVEVRVIKIKYTNIRGKIMEVLT